MVPLFPGIPGGPELLIILLVMVLLLGVPLVLLLVFGAGAGRLLSRSREREDRIAELEREVEELRERAGDAATGDERAAGDDRDPDASGDGDRGR
jgi:sec-independent protein translocase protein TatA